MPDGAALGGVFGGDVAPVADSDAPQLKQKRATAGLAALQAGQVVVW